MYFTQAVAAGSPHASLLWGIAISVSMVVSGAIGPLLGAMADHTAAKKRWLLFFTVMCIVPTALLFFVGPGDVASGIALFVLANVGFAAGNGLYNGFLSELSDETNVGRISGYGYALGYAGGLLALLICLPLLKGGFGPGHDAAFRSSFLVTAAFFAVFSLPTFLWLRERAIRQPRPAGMSLAGIGWERMRQTFGNVRQLGDLFRFLGAFLVYNDGIETVIYFSSIYAVSVLGFTMLETVWLFMAVQLTALVGSLLFGRLTDSIGPKPAILMTLGLWCGVVAAAYFATTKGQFWVIALVAGIGLGSNQVASRGLMRLFVPAGHDAEFFGFFSICGKFSSLLGPLVYGAVASMAGSQRIAILSVLAFFAVGFVLLMSVSVDRGRLAAREAGG